MVFYEAPHKLPHTLQDMLNAWGDRRVSISRELTKRYEETIRTTLSEAVDKYTAEKPRGEFVLVIEGAPEPDPVEDGAALPQALERLRQLTDGGLSLKDAARQTAEETGLAKNLLYTEGLKGRTS